MRILIDTNVLLDFLLGREPYFSNADRIIKMCADRKIQGFMAAHSVPNMFYILRKDMSEEARREVLLVTRNRKDFEHAEVPAILPEDFLKIAQD